MSDQVAEQTEYVIDGRTYEVCGKAIEELAPCACVNRRLNAYLCPDNTTCVSGGDSYPCVAPVLGSLTVCDGVPSYCYYCENKRCMSCENGYYFEAGRCKPCTTFSQQVCSCAGSTTRNCQTCVTPTGTACATCVNQHYLEYGHCFPCPGNSIREKCICGGSELYEELNCRECVDEFLVACKTCFNGYYLKENGACAECGGSEQKSACFCGNSQQGVCLTCALDGGIGCASCYEGFYLENGVCTPCASGCAACVSSTQCVRCAYNHRMVSAAGATFCETCPENMHVVVDENKCKCDKGYVMLSKCESSYAIWLYSLLVGMAGIAVVVVWVVELARRWKRIQ